MKASSWALGVTSLVVSACGDGAASLPAPSMDASFDATVNDGQASHVCGAGDGGVPTDLFCTGLYVNGDVEAFGDGVMAYTPGVTLWSDGAEKHRYLYLPPGEQIDTSNMDRWRFPVGTKAWKEFRLEGKLVETRFFWKESETNWESGTYVWDAMGEHASLNTNLKGTLLASGYEIPSDRDCGKCHHGGADSLLGVEAVALALPTAEGVTLEMLANQGMLSRAPAIRQIALPEDATGKAGPALAFLHANCGMPCHSTRGLGEETQLRLRLRADEYWSATGADKAGEADGWLALEADRTDVYLATVGQPPTTASVAQAFPDARRVSPGQHERSLVWLLAHRRGNYQMPPLVSHRVDEAGTQAVADWIDALMVKPDAR